MTKETEEKVEKIASELEDLTNDYGCHESLEAIANKMASMHKTLVQSFASGFILPFVKKMAEDYRCGKFDDRNRAAAMICEEMWTSVEDKYGLNQGEEIRLPCI